MSDDRFIEHLSDAMRERYQHVKRGTIYQKVGEAQVQAPDDAPLTDYEVVTVYVREDSKPPEYWVRRNSEFNDGRFVALPPILEADAMSDDRRKSLIVGNLPEETVAALKDAAMSDDTEKLLRDMPSVSEMLERFIANAMASARDESAAEIERVTAEAKSYRDALEWMRARDDRNGSLPEAYREKIDEALAAAALAPPTD